MAKTMTAAQPSMLKSAVTLWMKVTDPEAAAMTGGPAVPITLFAATRLCALAVAYVAVNWATTGPTFDLVGALCQGECLVAVTPPSAHESLALWGLAQASLLAEIPPAATLLVVGNLAAFAALWILYKVFQRLADERAAQWSIALLALFPFAYLQMTGHRDGLSLLFSALTAWFALDGRYLRAGLVAAVGVLVDPFVALGALLIGALHLRDQGVKRALGSGLMGALLPVLSLGGLALYSGLKFSDPLAFLAAGPNARPVGMELLASLSDPSPARGLWGIAAAAGLVTIGAVCLVLKRPWAPLLAFALPWVFLMWTFARGGLASHAALCWPAFLPLGAWLSRRPSLQVPVVAGSAILLGCFLLLYTRGIAIG
ncbi:MAG: glycosyltransferase family 39 protein [Myxococcota bacterium]|nr:glycosyltransferase family 39 protein [Myxococcota bacterium]